MVTQWKFIVLTVLIVIFGQITGCATDNTAKNHEFNSNQDKSYVIRGHNYSFAVYNSEHRLISHPVEDLMTEMKWREITNKKQISDIYFISHGWNFTLPVAVANYHNYIERIDKLMDHARKNKTIENFQPYFIFVTWTSTVRPTTNLIKAVVPFGVDTGLEPITSVVDKFPLHLLTNWKQSINASRNALGKHAPNFYLEKDWRKVPYGYLGSNLIVDDDSTMGGDMPVSALIYELIKKKTECVENNICISKLSSDLGPEKFDPYDAETDKYIDLTDTKIHLVGHSYGAKLVALSGMEALRRWMLIGLAKLEKQENNEKILADLSTSPETGHGFFNQDKPKEKNLAEWYDRQKQFPINSIILFNPAFTPGELSYPVGNNLLPLSILAPTDTLRFIPKKAIVFSNTDYANGALFNLRDLPLNGFFSQYGQSIINDENDFYENLCQKTLLICNPILSMVGDIVSGSYVLGWSAIYSGVSYAVKSVLNIPSDFLYHVQNNSMDGYYNPLSSKDNSFKIVGKGLTNAVDFFSPIKPTRLWRAEHGWDWPIVTQRDETEQGLFRSNTPALGKTGINHRTEGRWALLNLGGLTSFYSAQKAFGENINGGQPNPPFAINVDENLFCKYSGGEYYKETVTEEDKEFGQLLTKLDKSDELTLLKQREYFYSFDASKVFDSSTPDFVGAHSDLRSEKSPNKLNCLHKSLLQADIDMEKRDYTMNFILRFSRPDLANALFNPTQVQKSASN